VGKRDKQGNGRPDDNQNATPPTFGSGPGYGYGTGASPQIPPDGRPPGSIPPWVPPTATGPNQAGFPGGQWNYRESDSIQTSVGWQASPPDSGYFPAAGPLAVSEGKGEDDLAWGNPGRKTLKNVLLFGVAPLVLAGAVAAGYVVSTSGKGHTTADSGFHANGATSPGVAQAQLAVTPTPGATTASASPSPTPTASISFPAPPAQSAPSQTPAAKKTHPASTPKSSPAPQHSSTVPSPSPTTASPSPTPSPTASAGTVAVSASAVALAPTATAGVETGTLTITAGTGGFATYAITASSGLIVSPPSGTLTAGESIAITLTLNSAAAFSGKITISTSGGQNVSVPVTYTAAT
jgi:hypothetical protein